MESETHTHRQDTKKNTGHGVAAAADADARSAPQLGVRARRQALTDAYMRPCPQLGGGHPLVVVAEAGAHGGGRRGFAEVLLERLQSLTKDNDATPCKIDRRQNRRGLDAALKKCFASKTRYAAVAVVAKLPQPPLHIRGAPVLIACASPCQILSRRWRTSMRESENHNTRTQGPTTRPSPPRATAPRPTSWRASTTGSRATSARTSRIAS